MSTRKTAIWLVGFVVASSLLLNACSPAEEPAAIAVSTPTAASDGCDQAGITIAIENFYASTAAVESTGLALQSISSVACAGDWAVAQIVVGDGQGHDLGDYEVTQRTDGAWAIADRMTVCGTWNPKKPAQMPDDAVIDSALYSAACTRN